MVFGERETELTLYIRFSIAIATDFNINVYVPDYNVATKRFKFPWSLIGCC